MENIEKPLSAGMPTLSALRAKLAAAKEEARKRQAARTVTTTANEERAQELSIDGINDDRYGTRTNRRVVNNPPVAGTRATADVANVTHVPISKAATAAACEAAVPVVRDTTIAAQTRRDLTGLERGAAADSRREGSYASTVVAALPTATVDVTEVPLQGLATRVVQAGLAAATGAVAAAAPNVTGWDVRAGAVARSQTLLKRYGNYDVLVIPPDMPRGAAEALASLAVTGGAGAYGWRFAAGTEAENTMPSYVRWRYPGGRPKTLVLFEQPEGGYVFGGASLTVAKLTSLENWMRRTFGNELVDQAYKTMVAAGHVYFDPVATDYDPGDNLDAVQVTTTRDNVDYGRLEWQAQPAPAVAAPARYAAADYRDRPRGFDQAMWQAAMAGVVANVPANGHVRVNFDENSWMTTFVWRVRNREETGEADMSDVLAWLVDPDNGQNEPIRHFAMAFGTGKEDLGDMLGDEGRQDSDEERRNIRNVFSFSDEATMTVPVFDLARVAPAIAGVLMPTVLQRAATNVPEQLRDRCRSYAAKLHTVHLFSAVERGVWPDDLADMPLSHGDLVASLPDGMQPLAYLADPDRSFLSASNWQMLESSLRLKGTTRKTAYVGYDVPGTWVVNDNGRVLLDDDKTQYAAVDAALRATWNYGGTVASSVAGNVVVIDPYGYVAPLGISPVVRVRRRLRGVELEVGTGADLLGGGTALGFDTVRAI